MVWKEWPLMVFTVLAQSATGVFWWCCLILLAGDLSADEANGLEQWMLVIWLLLGLSFGLASLHLGRPMRAINALFRFGRSRFSNEIVFGSSFCGLGGLSWLCTFLPSVPDKVRYILLGLAFLLSLAFMINMAGLYLMRSVPTWNNLFTPLNFGLTILIGGSALTACLFSIADMDQTVFWQVGPLLVLTAGVLLAIASAFSQFNHLSRTGSAIKQARMIFPLYAPLMAARFALLVCALLGLVVNQTGHDGLSFVTGCLCVLLVLLAETIGRSTHYGIHMTSGLH